MRRSDLAWLSSLLVGAALATIGVYLFFRPTRMLDSVCIEAPCSIGLIAAAVVLVLGLILIGAGFVLWQRGRQAQTVVIAINDEAEKDAAAVEELEEALERKQNPERLLEGKVEGKARKRIDLEEFIQLPKEEVKSKKR